MEATEVWGDVCRDRTGVTYEALVQDVIEKMNRAFVGREQQIRTLVGLLGQVPHDLFDLFRSSLFIYLPITLLFYLFIFFVFYQVSAQQLLLPCAEGGPCAAADGVRTAGLGQDGGGAGDCVRAASAACVGGLRRAVRFAESAL